MTDIPGDLTTPATLTVGGSATGSLETVGDHDWYRITLTAGQAVTVNINLLTLEDSYLNIRDASGNILYSNDDIIDGVERGSQISFMPPSTGTYYIDVGAYNDEYAGTYQVTVQPFVLNVATNDQIAQQLVSGYWGGDIHHFNVTQGGTITVNISTLNAAEQNLARNALQEWSDIIGVHFQETTSSSANIMFDDSKDPSGPIAATDTNYTGQITTSAHVHISTDWVNNYGVGLNSYSFQSYVHEIGHALGLGHSGDYNSTADFPYDAKFLNDAWSTSVMSYFDQHENTYFGNLGFTVDYAVTPMAADIIAMQQLYGLSTTTRADDTVYGFNSNAGTIYDASVYSNVAYTIFDSGGNDTLNFFKSPAVQLLNLNPETFSNVNGGVGNLVIARGVTIENAIGGKAGDTIIGNSVDNVLTGNGGADTLTGGGGNDTFSDTEAGHNGDTITDFGRGDAIVFTDASLGSFTYSLSGNTLSFTGGSLTLSNLPGGHISISAAPTGGVQLTDLQSIHNDFNGDGRSDILWANDNGAVFDLLGTANGGFTNNGDYSSLNLGTGWHVAGTADLNGDGKADMLLRNDNGAIFDLLGTANGGFTNNGDASFVSVATSWHVAGTGDFNGDGRDDILWRNDNGTIYDMLGTANGGVTNNGDQSSITVGTAWHVAGIGDFNNDGRDDILWRNDNGAIFDMLGTSTGGFVNNGDNSSVNMPTSWHVAGIGDFNGDGFDDILWRNDSGAIYDMLGRANGAFVSNGDNSSVNVDNSWHLASVADFNGDGRSDILWRNDSGAAFDMLATANGGFVNNGDVSYLNIPVSWHVQDLLG